MFLGSSYREEIQMPPGNYWTATADTQRALGGNPKCPTCGERMFPIDDHGRFRCPNNDDPDSNIARAIAAVAANLGKQNTSK